MSVKIRLTKIGKRNQIQYRIVAQDTRTKRDGKFLEILGNFNPKAGEKLILKKDEYDAWVKKGAKPTPSLSYLLENGKLPKKVKKAKVEPKAPDQKPAEPKTETPSAQDEEVAQAAQTKDAPAEKSGEPKKSEAEPEVQNEK